MCPQRSRSILDERPFVRISAHLRCAGDFWSLRVVDERAETYAVRKNVPQPPASSRRSRRDADRLGRRWLRLRRDQRSFGRPVCRPRSIARSAWARATRSAQPDRFPRLAKSHHGANTPRPTSTTPALVARANGTTCSPRNVAMRRLRRAHRRLGSQRRDPHRHAPVSDQRRRRSRSSVTGSSCPTCSVSAHADGDTQTRTLNGYRGPRPARRESDAERFGFAGSGRRDRRRGAAAAGRTELPDRQHGRPADARPDDPADPRIDRPSAGTRPHPRRRAQLRRHQLRHSRHVRNATATDRSCSTSASIRPRPKSWPATASTTTARRAEKRPSDPRRHPRAPAGRDASRRRAPGSRGVANSRADDWNRPPIDRMANLNLEPARRSSRRDDRGDRARRADATNSSWSIDDSRNKFQFGCEWGQLIENGKLTTVVKNPNYRGISAKFWRSLSACRRRFDHAGAGHPVLRQGRTDRRSSASATHRPRACSPSVDVFGGDDDGDLGDGNLFQRSRRACSTVRCCRAKSTPARFDAEVSDFVRMNRGKVRQPGTVVAALRCGCI